MDNIAVPDSIEICREVRTFSDFPIIIVTALLDPLYADHRAVARCAMGN